MGRRAHAAGVPAQPAAAGTQAAAAYFNAFVERTDNMAFRLWLQYSHHAQFVTKTAEGGARYLPAKEQHHLAILYLRFIAGQDPWWKPHNLRLRASYLASRMWPF